ncbi:MAG: sugar kinase [Planctomycetota bacterium]|nr:sugar kinase [Planctomycetota bacterium]
MRVLTFGEVMLRMCPEGNLRLRQVLPGTLNVTFGGGELNVAVSIALQGGDSAFMTALPDNILTDALIQEMRKLNVDASFIQRVNQGRFGIYFVETGADQRGGTVTYDREGSSIALQPGDSYPWAKACEGADWFHITGITPAISKSAAAAALLAVQQAKTHGLTVSCDLNFRKKLWNWEPGTKPVDLARKTMKEILNYVDVVIANEEDAELTLGIGAPHTDVSSGRLDLSGYEFVAKSITEEFPQVSRVAITLRESVSASHNNWGAMYYDLNIGSATFAPLSSEGEYRPYEMRHIVDRVGAGDSFAGALIFALNTPELNDPSNALRYAVAASCLKHSMYGDFNYATRSEIEALMSGSTSGRVQR